VGSDTPSLGEASKGKDGCRVGFSKVAGSHAGAWLSGAGIVALARPAGVVASDAVYSDEKFIKAKKHEAGPHPTLLQQPPTAPPSFPRNFLHQDTLPNAFSSKRYPAHLHPGSAYIDKFMNLRLAKAVQNLLGAPSLLNATLTIRCPVSSLNCLK
jgi:hypothetical protein